MTRRLKNHFEIRIFRQLRRQGERTGYEVGYETDKLPYIRSYLPDYTLKKGLKTLYIEAKGWFRESDRTKMIAVKKHNPELDIRLVFQNDRKLNKRSKMLYSDWCKRYNFPCAVGSIPREWLEQ